MSSQQDTDNTTTDTTLTPQDTQNSINAGGRDLSKVSYVSGKGLLYNARLPKSQRVMLLKALLAKGYTDKQLASMLKCTERTIYNYKQEFFDSEGFWLQVKEEIYSLLHDDQVPKVARLQYLVAMWKTHTLAIQVDKSFEGSAPLIEVVYDAPSPSKPVT